MTLTVASARAENAAGPVDFARDVYPLLQRACFECHGPRQQKSKLRLDTRALALRGGRHGAAIVPGKADQSELYRRVSAPQGSEEIMPARGKALSASQVQLIREWINQGALWVDVKPAGGHWAYQTAVRPPVPVVTDANWPQTTLDRFILARLEKEGLQPSPAADRAVLIRRVTLDLTGLPPSPEEVHAFLRDTSPLAYQSLVDRLLASPQFGERWARPWLDLARYADSHGFQRDDLRPMWAYRDWVIRALNADMPFDRFTLEQVAGDLLPGATLDQKIATGFFRCSPSNVEAGTDPEETRVNQIIDRVNTAGAVWLGTTLECAQCHDHKYDPFTQQDYYGLFAFFNNTATEVDRANPNVPGSIRFLGPFMELPDSVRAEEQARVNAELKCLEQEDPARLKNNRKAIVERTLKTLRSARTLAMAELPQPRTTKLFLRGDFRTPGQAVEAGTPPVLHAFRKDKGPRTKDEVVQCCRLLQPNAWSFLSSLVLSPLSLAPTRLDLARWFVDRDNPLAARVTVNRWWAELFGRGIVSTVEDFGLRGEPPTNPELLDWLAVEFMDSGWSMKHVLRQIVLSATYRQLSKTTPALLARDDQNSLLARGSRFRMEAEMIRDNALAVAGLLGRKQFGPPIRPYQPGGFWVKVGGDALDYVVSPVEDRYRRGVYVVWKRGTPYPSFVNFDATARLACTVKRSRSNTPLQALTLLNDPVYVEAALALAKRIVSEQPAGDVDERLRHAVRLCVARAPGPGEVAALRKLYQEQLHASGKDHKATEQLLENVAVPAGVSREEFAAWYAVATALLNLDETITKG